MMLQDMGLNFEIINNELRYKTHKDPDDWHRWRYWSAFKHFGTHLAESFRVSEFSWMMDPSRSRKMPSCSAIDLAEIRHPVFQD
jgi:hypothetical protein